ncbi:MAG: peptidoglycan-associated lipoprotein Pal [Deltaproteobacteria bacterium]|nr:peptidoglycan-associated lipoprotein Pal [Deltaproteobacteria bacterium]
MKCLSVGRFFAATVTVAALFFIGCAGPEVVKEEQIAQKAAAPEAAPQAEAEKPPEVKPAEPEAASAAPKAAPSDITVAAIPEETAPPKEEPKVEPTPPPVTEVKPVIPEKVDFYTIYFDFDKYAIRDTDKNNIVKDAELLRKYPGLKAVLEGHADERGETEYNLALGDKRAKSVERYLKTLGINPVRLTTISYGEERPAVSGHDEEAWAKNRRVEFISAE